LPSELSERESDSFPETSSFLHKAFHFTTFQLDLHESFLHFFLVSWHID
jgi:hypothetical protein